MNMHTNHATLQLRHGLKTAALGLASFAMLALAAQSGIAGDSEHAVAKQDKAAKQQMAPKDIVDTAIAAGSFTTLVKAIQAAGLVETLKGKGPFTVFAPTDDAFAKLPAEQLQALLADKAKLTAVLTYHVVPGKVTAAQVTKLTEAKTVEGQSLKITASKEGVQVDGAHVIKADVMASNGVIHVIDSVLMPQ